MSVPNCSEQVRNRGCSECSKPLSKRLAEHCLAGMANPTVRWGLLIPKRSARDSGFGTPLMGVETPFKTCERDPPIRMKSTLAVERHFSPAEIAELWKLSTDCVRKILRNEQAF